MECGLKCLMNIVQAVNSNSRHYARERPRCNLLWRRCRRALEVCSEPQMVCKKNTAHTVYSTRPFRRWNCCNCIWYGDQWIGQLQKSNLPITSSQPMTKLSTKSLKLDIDRVVSFGALTIRTPAGGGIRGGHHHR